MWLTCKKTYYVNTHSYVRLRIYLILHKRIEVGKKYKVIHQKTIKGGTRDGARYWCFEIPEPNNKIGSGWFDIDEYFLTPEEERDLKISQLV